MPALLVLTNCPDAGVAETIASTLVEARLAACVNILPPARSVYRGARLFGGPQAMREAVAELTEALYAA